MVEAKPLNVAQLIARLRKLDPSMPVFTIGPDGYGGPLDEEGIEIGICGINHPTALMVDNTPLPPHLDWSVWRTPEDVKDTWTGVQPALIICS